MNTTTSPTLPLVDHADCNGTGRVTARSFVGHAPDGGLVPSWDGQLEDLADEKPDPVQDCVHCKGHGYVPKNGYGAYRTVQALKGGRTKGTAQLCRSCKGSGRGQSLAFWTDCYRCNGLGKIPAWSDDCEPVLPEGVSNCQTMSEEFAEGYVQAITWYILRTGDEMSWGAANLGLGGVTGAWVDYGRSLTMSDVELLDEMVTSFVSGSGRPQFTKCMNRETRRLSTVMCIYCTRQGRQVVALDVPPPSYLLPPTYTSELMNQPAFR